MRYLRIIPRLDIKGPNLVKGIHLEGLRVLGRPNDFAKYYYQNGADEIFLMDVVASLYERNNLHDIIEQITEGVFIPITVGGGLRSFEDINKVLRAGADKVSLNTAVIKNPDFLLKASEKFGSSTIVVSIEVIKDEYGNYMAFIDNGREATGVNAIEWAHQVEELGAGEILLTSVDNEGTGKGFDLELIKKIGEILTIPLVVHGGAGKLEHIHECFSNNMVDGVCLASILHYNYIQNNDIFVDTKLEGNFDFILNKRMQKTFDQVEINSIKQYLINSNFKLRD